MNRLPFHPATQGEVDLVASRLLESSYPVHQQIRIMIAAIANPGSADFTALKDAMDKASEDARKKVGLFGLELSSDDWQIPVEGGDLALTIDTEYAWFIHGMPEWISSTAASGDSGTSQITLSAIENAGPVRDIDMFVCCGRSLRRLHASQQKTAWIPSGTIGEKATFRGNVYTCQVVDTHLFTFDVGIEGVSPVLIIYCHSSGDGIHDAGNWYNGIDQQLSAPLPEGYP